MEALSDATISALAPIINYVESWSFIGVNTYVIKHPALDQLTAQAAESIGMDETLVKYTIALFLVYPFAAVHYQLPNKNLKHIFNLVVGLALVQWIFGPDWIHSFITSLGTYLICALFPKRSQHLATFVFVMGYMLGSHIYRMYVSYMSGVFDFTGTQMVLTMKLTSFAYNLYDGVADRKNVFPEKPHEDKRKAKVYADRQRYAVEKLPNPLEFFGYIYCFTCILAGPAFEFRDYQRAVDGSAYQYQKEPVEDKLPEKATNGTLQKHSAADSSRKPSPVAAGLFCLLQTIVCLVGYLQLSPIFPVKQQYDLHYIATVSWPIRFLTMLVTMFVERLKFYFAWKVAEGASVMAGFGFEGYTKSGESKGWRGVQNIDILGFETASNIQGVSRHWNKRTQGWLERYTYHRTNKSLVATYFVSAIWHGLYPGFFIMFMSLPLMTNVERLIKAKINPLVAPGFDGYNVATYPNTIASRLYWLLCWAVTVSSINYVVQVFSMGSLHNCMTALYGHRFLPHVAMVALYIILELVPSQRKAKDKTV